MATEMYSEKYTEAIDIYAFGKYIPELVTMQYPYSKCENTTEIYKRVKSNIASSQYTQQSRKDGALTRKSSSKGRQISTKGSSTARKHAKSCAPTYDACVHREKVAKEPGQ